LISARFDTALTLSSPNHPDAQDGEIQVNAGSRIPGVPQHHFKLTLSRTIGRFAIGGNLLAESSQYFRGDEANLLEPLDGLALVQLTAGYALTRRVAVTVRITNLFGSEYSTFGLLGDADDVLGDEYDDTRFVSPGAPRAAWVGLQFSFR
jgi:outer membrane receptor protein involved in Fe transport